MTFHASGVLLAKALLQSNPNEYNAEKEGYIIDYDNRKVLVFRDNQEESMKLPDVFEDEFINMLTLETDNFKGNGGTCKEGETLVSKFH